MNNNAIYNSPRLFVYDKLSSGEIILFNQGQSHYLQHVLRLENGSKIRLFNGLDGEWLAEIMLMKKQVTEARIIHIIKEQNKEQDLRLYCALIKKSHFDFLIMKATELGVTSITPCLTSRTQVRNFNTEHAIAIAIEAAEQSERLSIPEIFQPIALKKITNFIETNNINIICAEKGNAKSIKEAFQEINGAKFNSASIITGPEGGFSYEELKFLCSLPNALPVRLGPRILRADTAAIAAISCWQAFCGNWC